MTFQVATDDGVLYRFRLMGEVVPTHCAKCRSRKWNTGGPVVVHNPLARNPLEVERVLIPEPEVRPCTYEEWSGELGQMMACGLPEHGPKTKHGNWRVID